MGLTTAGAILGAGVLGASASRSASRRQASATRTASNQIQQADATARRDLEPFRSLGGQALNPLIEFASTPMDDSVQRENIIRSVQNTGAARGKLGSGGTLLELSRQLFGMQQANRRQRFNELFDLVTLGSNAAARQATGTRGSASSMAELGLQGANARAAGDVGVASNLSNSMLLLSMLNRNANATNARFDEIIGST